MDWHKQSRRCALVVACLPPELAPELALELALVLALELALELALAKLN